VADLNGDSRSLASSEEPWGVNVAGWLTSSLGLGEAARSVVRALDAQRVPVMPVHGSFTFVPAFLERERFPFVHPRAAPFRINLLCVTPPALPPFLADAGPRFMRGRYAVGFWFWELSVVPPGWRSAFSLVDEVWAASDYVAGNLRAAAALQAAQLPVTTMRLPVVVPRILHTRPELGLPGGFLFLFMFDFHSAFERKNPLAVVESFRRAFGPGSGASLLIKCMNHDSDPANHARLLAAAARHPDVHVRAGYMSDDHKNALMAACDCYVSLHRAEGFGLTPAEAMYLGKPVVATGYSGNLEFMTGDNSYLVDYAMKRIEVDHPPYPPGGEWAEPDVDHAAQLMATVFARPDDAGRRAARGAADVRTHLSPERTGEAMRRRLQEISRTRLVGSSPRRSVSSPPVAAWRQGARRLARLARAPQDRVIAERRRTAVRVAGLLSELRQQEEAIRELRAAVAALERRLGRLDETRTAGATGGSDAER